MTISGVGSRTSYIGSGILDLRSQLDTLTQQLSSGKVSNTYAGQGSGRGLAIGLRAQLSTVASYADTATNLNTRIGVANLSLQRLVAIGSEVKGAAVSAGGNFDNTGQTPGQRTAQLDFADSVDMLNAKSGDRYLFSGRATDTAPVAPADQIMNGNGAAIAGLKRVIAERNTADLGANKNGRVGAAIDTTNSTAVAITEEEVTPAPPQKPQPFGMKVSSISTTIVGAQTTDPVDLPATPVTVPPTAPATPVAKSMSIDLQGNVPKAGDQVTLTFAMPDGTEESIVLTASDKTPLPANSFAIGAADPAAVPPLSASEVSAKNLNASIGQAMKDLTNGPMVAASAIEAGNNFFDNPPLRVKDAGTNAAGATELVDGTDTTVIWYHGEQNLDDNGPARSSAVSQIDTSISVQYGARADEQALRNQLQTVAVFAAVSVNPNQLTDPAYVKNANAQIAALNQRVAKNLADVPGQQTVENIQADFAGAQAAIKSSTDRQVQTKAMAQTMLDSIEGINNDEVATKILALQTALQASYQTTSTLYQMSLVKFL